MRSNIKVGIASSLLIASQVNAEDSSKAIKVGIIDSPVHNLFLSDENTSISNKNFVTSVNSENIWKNKVNRLHGEVVASSFVEQVRKIDANKKIEIFSATAFFERKKKDADGKKSLSLDPEALMKSLDWFHENGVRVIVVSFVMKDGDNARNFVSKLKSMNMVLFASTNNNPSQPSFPAKYPGVISISSEDISSGENDDIKYKTDLSTWISFSANGKNPRSGKNFDIESGSSFAAPRAAAFGACYLNEFPDASFDNIFEVMRQSSTKKSFSGNFAYSVGDQNSISMFKQRIENKRFINSNSMINSASLNNSYNGI